MDFFNNANAFEPFYDRACAYTGTRRENGTARALSLRLRVALTGPAQEETPGSAVAPDGQLQYGCQVRRADFSDNLAPVAGDLLTFPDGLVLKVVSVVPAYSEFILTLRSA